MAAIAEVVAVVYVVDIDVVGLIPLGRPGFRPGINNGEPEAAITKTGTSVDDNHGSSVDAKTVSTAKVLMEISVGNAVAHVPPAFMPRVVFVFPMVCTFSLPDIARRRMRRFVPVFGYMCVGWPIMGLMRIWPVRLLVLGRTYIPVVFVPVRLVIIRMWPRSVVAVIISIVVPVLL